MSSRLSRTSKTRALQDRTNQVADSAPVGAAKKQRGNNGSSVTTVQVIDVEPSTRVTRRQSREKEEREKTEATKIASSSSSNDTSLATKSTQNIHVHDDKAEIKSSASSGAVAKIVVKKSKIPAPAAPAPVKTKVKPASTLASASIPKAKPKAKPKPKSSVSSKNMADASLSSSYSSSTSADLNTSCSSTTSSRSSLSSARKTPTRRRQKRSDPSQCLEIIAPMYNLFYSQEEDYLVKPYMSTQKDINNRMRGILVDWLVEVHYKFRLQSPTLWLCVNLLDRYLEKKTLLRNKLQLLGVTCLLVACKFEEIYPPEVRDCVYITDNAYTREEVLSMEQSILAVLDYQLCVPTGYHFLTRYLNIINASEKTRHLAFYYAERNLQESISFNHKPSELMSAALYAALVHDVQGTCRYDSDDEEKAYPHAVWPDLLIEETGFDESDLLPVGKVLMKHVGEEPVTTSMRHLIAAKKKYLNDKFFNVAELGLPDL